VKKSAKDIARDKLGGHIKMFAQFLKHNKPQFFVMGDAFDIEAHFRRYLNSKTAICNDWGRVFRHFKAMEEGDMDENVRKGLKNPYQRCRRFGITINDFKTNEDNSKVWEIKYGIQGT